MDLLDSPEVKKKYEDCKRTVKIWEYKFKKKYGRVPSKYDIREANRDIRYAYKTYFNIKSAMIERSFIDVDGFNSDEEGTKAELDDTIDASEVEGIEGESISKTTINETELGPNVGATQSFSESHNEKPNTCTQLKTMTETCSFINVNATSTFIDPPDVNNANSDKTWGEHLNNKKKPENTENDGVKMKVNSSFTKKLFNGSKFSKRNPRKSLSFSHNKSESNFEGNKSLSQPETSSCSPFTESQTLADRTTSSQDPSLDIFGSNFKIVPVEPELQTRPLNIIQSVVDSSYKPVRNLDTGWVRRTASKTGVELLAEDLELSSSITKDSGFKGLNGFPNLKKDVDNTKIDYDSDIIEESDEEETSRSICHIVKKRKVEKNEPKQPEVKKLDFSNIFDKSGEVTVIKDVIVHDFKQPDEVNVLVENTPIRKSGRERKTRVSLERESSSENEDPFKCDNDSDDPEFNLPTDGKKKHEFLSPEKISPVYKKTPRENKASLKKKEKKIQTPKEKTAKTPKGNIRTPRNKKTAKKQEEEDGDSEESKVYELEFSIKPRIRTVPRVDNLKKVLLQPKNPRQSKKEENKKKVSEEGSKTEKDVDYPAGGLKDKRQQAKEKLEKKIASGSLNQNFVQINLKKKMFVRGKTKRSFSAYKKQLWKKQTKALAGPDMDMGGCDGGMLTCFNCGKTGHFARQCKETKGDALLPLEADQEPCPYPTLEEAREMAKDDKLVIRKPTIASNIENSQDEEEGSNQEDIPSEFEFEDLDDEDALLEETLRIEESVQKLDVQNYLDATTIVKPYYELKEDGSLIDTPKEVFNVLEMFGHKSFRPGQEQAIMRILSGQSTLVTLSTGSGKSLCYQLPAYLYSKREPCISLIISPLVSLMEDQITGIPHLIRAACLHTNQTKVQREKIMNSLTAGELSILLISPEAVVAGEKSSGFGSLLRKLPPIAFACIDEAHCVSQWSHNFRPSYLMICRILRERLGVSTILGLTATATRATSDSIIDHLQIPDGRNGIITDKPLPNNLRLTVSKDGRRDAALLALLQSEEFSNFKSIIIYCIRRDECERIASFLRTSLRSDRPKSSQDGVKKRKRQDVEAEPYHAGLSASRRRTIQKRFMSNELRIVVATVAFGMGINKTDLRAVIHYNMPKNFESYVQEIGRAGRDGLPAHCHLFLDSQGQDECELRRHIHANSMDRHVIRKLLQKIFIPCSCKQNCPKHEVAFSIQETVQALDIPEENISTLLCYLELHKNRYIEVLSPAYTTCKIISYGGPLQIRKAAKDCPPLAMALALHKGKNDGVLEFPVIDIASQIGWDSGICKHKLKNLEWTSVNGQPKRSTLSVQFLNLGFRLLAPGNLDGAQLDEALDNLFERVTNQEKTALLQLHALHTTLCSVAVPSFRKCLEKEVSEKEELLKDMIREYFESPKPLEILQEMKEKPVNEEVVTNSVRSLVNMYRDNNFTGRAMARIFHGIQSPNYPAVIWGRCKFWRAHITEDFHTLCRIATREILKMRL